MPSSSITQPLDHGTKTTGERWEEMHDVLDPGLVNHNIILLLQQGINTKIYYIVMYVSLVFI